MGTYSQPHEVTKMNALDLLKQQHKEVASLFEKYAAEDDIEGKRQLFIQIADELSAHSAIEEKIFYPGVKTAQTESILKESVEEHFTVKKLIADLLDLEPADADFDRKMKALREDVFKHVEEEEGELFPLVQKSFSKDQLSAMGDRMERMYDELAEEEPRKDIPSQLDEPAQI